MRSKFNEEEKPQNHERWLLTYADLITLLMIFFVIMYAMSNVDTKKYEQLNKSLNGVFEGGDGIMTGTENKMPSDTVVEQQNLENLKKQLEEYIHTNNLDKSVSINIEPKGLVISLKDTIMFDTGKAQIKETSKDKLIEIGKMFNKTDNYIRVEGHTDNIPIKNGDFKSNWELSAIRSTNVIELFINYSNVSPERLSSVGYGEFRPIADNSTEEGKSKNRRVDIIILKSKFNSVEESE
jgi:chemotaxis protein MotB